MKGLTAFPLYFRANTQKKGGKQFWEESLREENIVLANLHFLIILSSLTASSRSLLNRRLDEKNQRDTKNHRRYGEIHACISTTHVKQELFGEIFILGRALIGWCSTCRWWCIWIELVIIWIFIVIIIFSMIVSFILFLLRLIYCVVAFLNYT